MKSIVFNPRVYDLPYLPHNRTSAYIDLRVHLARIDEIPELQSEQRLKSLIIILNDTGGMFMTHACAIGCQKPGIGAEIRIPHGAKDARCWYSSYVIFSFHVLEQNKREHYETIYESYPSDRDLYNIAFEIEPAYFCTPYEQNKGVKMSHSDRNGTICGIWVSGWGANEREAQNRWSGGIDDLVGFFGNPPPAWDRFASSTGATLSKHMFGC